jgi:N-acetylmuramoyl-L-alanine amidase
VVRIRLPNNEIKDIDLNDPALILDGYLESTTPPPPIIIPPITAATPFRQLPVISKERLCAILVGTPMAAACGAIHAALGGRPLPVAQSWMESRYGKDENAQRTHNPLGLLDYTGTMPVLNIDIGGFTIPMIQFSTWDAAFREWARRMDDPAYKGGVYMPLNLPLSQLIRIYVAGPGPGFANGESAQSVRAYLDATVARLNRYYEVADLPAPPDPTGYTAHAIAGSVEPLLLPSTLRFRQHLTTVRPNRTYRAMNWTGNTQHTTGNTRHGTGATMHANWQFDGTPGHPDGAVSVHFYVDDKEVVQTLPVDEQGIHAGDWRNQQHVAVELCVNQDRDARKAESHAVYLQAGLLRLIDTSAVANLYPHTRNAEGHCPRLSVLWPEWERRVDEVITRLRA